MWQILLQIPYGQTVTYGEIASKIAEMKNTSRMSAQAVAAEFKNTYPGIHFYFYSGDAVDVLERLNHGSPVPFVMQGLGYFLITRDLLAPTLAPNVCFLPLEPKLPTRLALVWKKYAVFSKVAKTFINTLEQS